MNTKINFGIIDALRGFAALYVLLSHCRAELLIGGFEFTAHLPLVDWSWWDKIYFGSLQLTILNREAVILFFVLSGFSISHSLQQNQGKKIFYIKRLIRLYPPYLIALIWAAACYYFFIHYYPEASQYLNSESVFGSLGRIWSNLFYITDGQLIPQFWSLKHEVFFYLIAPWVLYQIGIKKGYILGSIVLFLVSFVYSPFTTSGNHPILIFIFDYNIYFVFGILCYDYLPRLENMKFFSKANNVYFLLLGIPTMIILSHLFGFYTKFNLLISAGISAALLVFSLKYQIKNSLLSWFGKFSYTIYITHYASLFLFMTLTKIFLPETLIPSNNWFTLLAGIVFCLVLSYIFYLIVEFPTRKYIAYIRQKNKLI